MIFYSMFLNLCITLYCAKEYTVITGGFEQKLIQAGFSGMGGAIGLLFGILLFGFIRPVDKAVMLRAYVQALPLLYSVSKLGCLSAGCCRGIDYSGPLSVTYETAYFQGGPFFPVQLAESMIFALIFLLGVFLERSSCRQYMVPAVIALCAVSKFFLEIFRAEHTAGTLSPNRIACIVFSLLSAVWTARSIRKKYFCSKDKK